MHTAGYHSSGKIGFAHSYSYIDSSGFKNHSSEKGIDSHFLFEDRNRFRFVVQELTQFQPKSPVFFKHELNPIIMPIGDYTDKSTVLKPLISRINQINYQYLILASQEKEVYRYLVICQQKLQKNFHQFYLKLQLLQNEL